MPLEIRELVIKATVGDKKAGASAAGSSNAANGDGSNINEIVSKVLEIIKEKNER